MSFRYLALALCCCWSATVFASIEEDYQKAVEVYGTQGDIIGGAALMKKVADAGHPKAQSYYGFILDAAGESVEAVKYLKLAAEQGDPEGLALLGAAYASGNGVDVNLAEAFRLTRDAAEKGHLIAIRVMVNAYTQGGLGIDPAVQDNEVVLKWLKKGVEIDDAKAMIVMRDAYAKGLYGLAIDPVAAAKMSEEVNRVLNIVKKEQKKGRRQKK